MVLNHWNINWLEELRLNAGLSFLASPVEVWGKKKEKNTGHVIKPVINVSTIYEIWVNVESNYLT